MISNLSVIGTSIQQSIMNGRIALAIEINEYNTIGNIEIIIKEMRETLDLFCLINSVKIV